MITRQAVLGAILAVLLSWAVAPGGRLDADDVRAFALVPIELHLFIAETKLDEHIAEAEERNEPEKAARLRDAKGLLADARRRYDFTRPDGTAGVSPELALPEARSPLSLLQHLWFAADAVAQLRSRLLFEAQHVTGNQAETDTMLDKAIMELEKAIKKVEAESEWIVHWHYGKRMMVSLPAAYTWAQPVESDLLRRIRKDSQGETTGLFYIRELIPTDAAGGVGAAPFREEKIADLRRRFPDLQIVAMGETASEPESFTATFSYRYTWEGEPIHGVVYTHFTPSSIFEINCVAPVALFDQQEADGIIASFFIL